MYVPKPPGTPDEWVQRVSQEVALPDLNGGDAAELAIAIHGV